jgi:hypothetical protein
MKLGNHQTLAVLILVVVCAGCSTPSTSASVTPTPSPAPTLTPTLWPSPAPTATPIPSPTPIGGGSGRLIFWCGGDDGFLKAFPDWKDKACVFEARTYGTNITPVAPELKAGSYIIGVSPDGQQALISSSSNSRGASLYLVNLNALDSAPLKLADGLAVPDSLIWSEHDVAKWVGNQQVVYIGQGEAGFGIYIVNADGTDPTNVYQYNGGERYKPYELLAVEASSRRVFWDADVDRVEGGNRHFHKYYAWSSSLAGTSITPLEYGGQQIVFGEFIGSDLAISPDGSKVAWNEAATASNHHNYLRIASTSDMDHPYLLSQEPITSLLALKWWPDSSRVLAFDIGTVDERLHIDPASDLYGVYSVSADPALIVRNYHIPPELLGTLATRLTQLYDISPDGRQIVVVTYEKDEAGDYAARLQLFDFETQTFVDVPITISKYGMPYGIHWIP